MKKASMVLIIALSLTLAATAVAYADGERGVGQYCTALEDGSYGVFGQIFFYLVYGAHDVCVAAENNGNSDPVALCKRLDDIGILDDLDVTVGQCIADLRHSD